MTDLQQLLEQKAALDKQIENTLRQERSGAISQVKALMEQHGLTIADLGLKKVKGNTGSGGGAKKGGTVAAKYRNRSTGDTWSGRGLQPKWLKAALENGGKLEDFTI